MQPITPKVVQEIVDGTEERELWILGKEYERPPYFHAGKGMDTRLAKALRVVVEGRITPNSDGSFTVEGSEGRTYRCTDSCSCPNSQKSRTKWCYHLISTSLYVELQKRLRPPQPVALGTLRAGTLPLPPTTVDERLSHPATPEAVWRDVTQEELMQDEADTHHTPQEDRMADDAYTPEPDDQNTPVAIVEPPAATPAPMAVLLPSLDARTLEQSMQAWSAQRQVVKRFLQQELKEGVDFYSLRIKGRETKPTLSKAGAEKFLGLFQLQAFFETDLDTWEMLGKPTDLILYTCRLKTRSGEVVGEGRGARSLQQEGGDTNKAIKMAQKSALIDTILRTGALSEVFTQDAEDRQEPEPVKAATPAKPTSQDLRQRIWAHIYKAAPQVKTQIAAVDWIKEHTGMDMHPDNYESILTLLETFV